MKKLLSLIFIISILIIAACSDGAADADNARIEALYDSIDLEMARSHDYQHEKERRISALRENLATEIDEYRRLTLTGRLISEFESYQSDSALHYVNAALDMPVVKSDPRTRARLLIKKADITSHAGLFADALNIISGVHPDPLDSILLEEYYSVYCGIYQYQSEYIQESEFKKIYENLRGIYIDSLLSVTPRGSFTAIINGAPAMARSGHATEALTLLQNNLRRYEPGTRAYSIIASIMAYIYGEQGDKDNYKRYLAQSAISDIRGVVKENMAIRELSELIFEEGDIARANRYLKQSFADANFFAARMRNAQSSRMLPVIDEAYNAQQQRLQKLQRALIAAISVLAASLLLAIWMILKQYGRLKRANTEARNANAELSDLSEKLKCANEELASINTQLKASDTVKEEYAGRFMEYCSSALSSLQHYHRSLRVLATQGTRAALVKKLESSEMIDDALKDFYKSFDEAILEIYPHFVTKFNELLRPDERVEPRGGELLTTELRVFALIRIGITDSEKISRFLRCSITTVYTYRSKMRKRALNPEDFENDVRKI